MLWEQARKSTDDNCFPQANTILRFFHLSASRCDEWLQAIGVNVLPSLFKFYLKVLVACHGEAPHGRTQKLTLSLSQSLLTNVNALSLLSSSLDLVIDLCDLEQNCLEEYLISFVRATSAVIFGTNFDYIGENCDSTVMYERDVLRRNASLVLTNIVEACSDCREQVFSILQSRHRKLMSAVCNATEVSIQTSLLRLARYFYEHRKSGDENRFQRDMDEYLELLDDSTPHDSDNAAAMFKKINLKSDEAPSCIEDFRRLLSRRTKCGQPPRVICDVMENCHIFLGKKKEKLDQSHAPATVAWNMRSLAVKAVDYHNGQPINVPYHLLKGCLISSGTREFQASISNMDFPFIAIYFSACSTRKLFSEQILPRLEVDGGLSVKHMSAENGGNVSASYLEIPKAWSGRKSSISVLNQNVESDTALQASERKMINAHKSQNTNSNDPQICNLNSMPDDEQVFEPRDENNASRNIDQSVFAGLEGDNILLSKNDRCVTPVEVRKLSIDISHPECPSDANADPPRTNRPSYAGTPKRLDFGNAEYEKPRLFGSPAESHGTSSESSSFQCKLVPATLSPTPSLPFQIESPFSKGAALSMAPSKLTKQLAGRKRARQNKLQQRISPGLGSPTAADEISYDGNGIAVLTAENIGNYPDPMPCDTKECSREMKERTPGVEEWGAHVCGNTIECVNALAPTAYEPQKHTVHQSRDGNSNRVNKAGEELPIFKDPRTLKANAAKRYELQEAGISASGCSDYNLKQEAELGQFYGNERNLLCQVRSKGSSSSCQNTESIRHYAVDSAMLTREKEVVDFEERRECLIGNAECLTTLLKTVRSLLHRRNSDSVKMMQRAKACSRAIRRTCQEQNRSDTERLRSEISKLKGIHKNGLLAIRSDLSTKTRPWIYALRKMPPRKMVDDLSLNVHEIANAAKRNENCLSNLKHNLNNQLQREYQIAKQRRTKTTKTDTLMSGISSLLGRAI